MTPSPVSKNRPGAGRWRFFPGLCPPSPLPSLSLSAKRVLFFAFCSACALAIAKHLPVLTAVMYTVSLCCCARFLDIISSVTPIDPAKFWSPLSGASFRLRALSKIAKALIVAHAMFLSRKSSSSR